MTENEAIEELKYDCNELGKAIPCDTSWGIALNEAYSIAISALEEIQQYRALGTLEELREAMEKQRAKKPTLWGDGAWDCPNCGDTFEIDGEQYDYCPHCGQAIDWSEEEMVGGFCAVMIIYQKKKFYVTKKAEK